MYSILTKSVNDEDRSRTSLASLANLKPPERISTGVPEFDKVLGGGIVPGMVLLIGGRRGSGKSTLLIQAANGYVQVSQKRALIASGEMNREDIALFAQRFGTLSENVDVLGNEGDVYKIVSECEERKPGLLILDSINTSYVDDAGGDVGSTTQVDACANYLTSFAKATKTAVFMISHLNKEGDFASSEKIQHLVDVLIILIPGPIANDEGVLIDGTDDVVELIIDDKNRYGPKNVRAHLEMTEHGLLPLTRKISKKLTIV